jgi:hypothetical protein
MLLHIRNRATGPARKLRGETALSRWLLHAKASKTVGYREGNPGAVHYMQLPTLKAALLGHQATGSALATSNGGLAGTGEAA